MIPKTPWTERRFNFDYPVTHFPVFLERLRGLVPRVEYIVADVDEDTLSDKPGDKWSIKEHIGHLIDLEELHEKRLGEFLDGKNKLSPADMSNKKTYEEHHNNKPIGKLINELRSTRNNFVAKLEKVTQEQMDRSALHPRLQKQMRLVDMVYFVAEHDDHHVTAIRELLSLPSPSERGRG